MTVVGAIRAGAVLLAAADSLDAAFGATMRPMSFITKNHALSTYSIVAADDATGQVGVAVQTHQPCVGWIVPWVEPGLGAIATQASANPGYGPLGLALLREGVAPDRVVSALVNSDDEAHRRQVAVVDVRGRAAAHTGSGCIAEAAHRVGDGFSVQANMMLRPTVVDAMYDAFAGADGDLAHRMLAALWAAQREGGDIRGVQSAALVVAPGPRTDEGAPAERHQAAHGPANIASTGAAPAEGRRNRLQQPRTWERLYDLRVDEHHDPLAELSRLVGIRSAGIIDDRGSALLAAGDVDGALETWEKARREAPDQEELAFWQAMSLADANPTADAVERAARIIVESLAEDPIHLWLELADRLQACGLIRRPHAAAQIRKAVSELT